MKLEDICHVSSGGTPSRSKSHFYGGDIPWAKISDIENSTYGILTETEETITEEGLKSIGNRIFSKGTLLFAMYGSIGKVAITGLEIATNQAILGIRPKRSNEVYLPYLKIWFESNKQKLINRGRGVALQNLSATIVRNLDIPLPSYSDQLHIANLLSKAGNLISHRKQSIALLDEFLKSTFLQMFGDPDKNEKGFQFVELDKLCSVIVDCPHSTPLKSIEKTNFPCIRTSELTNGYISWDSMQYLDESGYELRTQRLIPVEGDVVYGREGTYGDAIRIPSTYRFSLGQRTMLFRPNYKKTNSIFLWAMVRSDFVYRQAKKKNSGSTVGHVNVKDIKQFRILNPPIELQTRFAQIVEKIESLKSQYQSSLQELENLYGSLSQRAFRGELTLAEEQVSMATEPGAQYNKL